MSDHELSDDERDVEEREHHGDEEAGIGSRGHPRPRRRMRLRRSPLGVRVVDIRDQLEAVRAEIEAQRDEVDELRSDVAALWLAFGQHERTIRDLIAAVEALGGARVPWPGEQTAGTQLPFETEPLPGVSTPPLAFDPPGSRLGSEAIATQLAGLDDVLAAIDQATRSLERVYADGDEERERPSTQEPS